MSSIISDIFYNQTNNALLDNYLMHRNTNISNSGTSLHLTNLNHSHTEGDRSRDRVIEQDKVLRLRIVVECQTGGLWEVGLKLGMARVGEFGEIGEGKKGVDIGLEIGIEDLYKHNAMSLSVSECNQGIKKRMGVGYLPLESIRDMFENGIKMKNFVVNVKSIRFPYHKIRFNLQIEIKTGDYDDFVNQKKGEIDLSDQKSPQYSQIDNSDFVELKTTKYSTNLQNKDIKFIVQSVKIQNLKDVQVGVVGKMWSIGQQIQIAPNDIDRKGVKVQVYSEGDEIGSLHLNILLLFGGIVEGLFPVVSTTGECLGTAQLCCCKQTVHGSNMNNSISQDKCDERQGEMEKIDEISQLGCELQFTCIKVMCKQVYRNEKVKIILRTDKDLKVQTKCKVQQTKSIFNNIITITLQKPILILKSQSHSQVQVQIYVGTELVGYGTVPPIQHQHGQQNAVEFDTMIDNFSTNNWVCHVAMNIIQFSLPMTYFPNNKLFQSLQIIATVYHFIHKLNFSQQLESSICKLLLEHHQNLIYIQATRIAALLASVINQKKYYYGVVKESANDRAIVGDQERMSKLIRQIEYLDSQRKGYVAIKDLEAVASYYGLSVKIIAGAVERRKQQKREGSDKVLYLLVLQDVLVEMISYSLPQSVIKASQNQSSVPVVQIPILNPLQVPSAFGSTYQNEQISQACTSFVCIRSLQCTNMHLLLASGKIPSVKVLISSCQPYFKSKIYYSSCSPNIQVNRDVGIGACIVFIHCDFRDKENGEKEIGRIVIKEGQMVYSIRNEVQVRVRL